MNAIKILSVLTALAFGMLVSSCGTYGGISCNPKIKYPPGHECYKDEGARP